MDYLSFGEGNVYIKGPHLSRSCFSCACKTGTRFKPGKATFRERAVSRSKALPCRRVTSACAGGLGGALQSGGRFALEASALQLATAHLEHAEKVLCHSPTFRKST